MPLPANQVHPSMQTAAEPFFPNGTLHAGVYTLVFRVRRIRDGRLLREHRLINMPVRITVSTEVRTAVYYTKQGPVADTPLGGGVGMTYFAITGHTGIAGVRNNGRTLAATVGLESPALQGPPLPPGSSLIDGAAAIKDLQDMIFSYFFPQGSPPLPGVTHAQDLQLEFLNLTAPTSAQDRTGRVGWIIHPHRNLVDIQQEAPKPFLYTYTLQFPALGSTNKQIPDRFVREYTDPTSGLGPVQRHLADALAPIPATAALGGLRLPTTPAALTTFLAQPTAFLVAATAEVQRLNTIRATALKMLDEQTVKAMRPFLAGVQGLSTAVHDFVGGIAATIRFPLYAKQQVGAAFGTALDLPSYSVATLKKAAQDLTHLFDIASEARAVSGLNAGETLSSGVNDLLTLRLNDEPPVTLALGTLTSGPAIAAAIQDQIRALAPTVPGNASAYRDFTATFADGQYRLVSGTQHSDAAHVAVVVSPDPDLTPGDASGVLGLGLAHGGQEQAGSAAANDAIALLRGVEDACTHLLAFPDYFADQLDAQDARLAALLPPGSSRPQISGDQHMQETIITPGDSLQGIAARVGVDWQSLALVNRLTYPYLLEEPTTLLRGRVSSATHWSLSDTSQTWPVNAYEGQRVDIVGGIGAGQSRRILQNTATALVVDPAWEVVPEDISHYAIRSAENPVVLTGTVSSATARTVTNGALALVPDSQRGLTLVLTSGATAGERRRIMAHDQTTYTLDHDWDVIPPGGTLYLLLGPGQATRRQLVVGDRLKVPQPSAQAVLPLRSRLADVSAITGRQVSLEEQLFGRDLLLQDGALVYDPARGDAVSIAGLDNLRAALIHYVNLPIGELEYQPGIGSYLQEELGLVATLPLEIQVLSSLERTIRQDPRIAAMAGARMHTQGGVTQIAFGATAITGASIERVVVR